MTVWIVFAAMTAGALALLLWPLLRRDANYMPRAAFDVRVYRDQLAELDRERAHGTISAAEAESARVEISRRLIAADDAMKTDAGAPWAGSRRATLAAVAVGLCVPAIAIASYLAGGAPHLADRPPVVAGAPQGAEGRELAALVAEMGERLKNRPDDAHGWTLYAGALVQLGRLTDAAAAYRHAAGLDPDNAGLRARYGETLTFANDGLVTPGAVEAFEQALVLAPEEPRARYYLGLAARQAGNHDDALRRWVALQAESGPDAPWHGMLASQIAGLAAEIGLDEAALDAMRADAAAAAGRPPGPGAADIEAAQSMSPDERAEAIRGIVARLAERLEAEPGDVAGWARLARSYEVLGEAEKAREAHARIATLRPDDTEALAGWGAAIARAHGPEDGAATQQIAGIADRILALEPGHPGGLWFAGLARARSGDADGAREHWSKLLTGLPEDSQPAHEVRRRLEALEAP